MAKHDQHGRESNGNNEALRRLHEDTNGALSSRVTVRTQPSFSYADGKEPHVSFLDDTTGNATPYGKTSSDYSNPWMDEADLPSPSALVANDRSDISENRVGAAACGSPSPVLNDHNFDLEVDMTDMSDSATLEAPHSPLVRQDYSTLPTLRSTAKELSSTLTGISNEAKLNLERRSDWRSVDVEEKLFLSTDSPEKLPRQAEKRVASESEVEPLSFNAPDTKRQKTRLEPSAGFSQRPNDDENVGAQPKVKLKDGHPAWVYDFDPDFIAEFEDVAEFV